MSSIHLEPHARHEPHCTGFAADHHLYMKSFYPLFGAATLALMSGSALSAELYLNTFLGSNPLKDLEVELDGRLLGTTDANGAVSGELKEGAHVLRVLEKRVPLTEYRFELAPGQSADLSLTFTDFAQPPQRRSVARADVHLLAVGKVLGTGRDGQQGERRCRERRGQNDAEDQALVGGGGTPCAKPGSPDQSSCARPSPSPQFYASRDPSPPLDTASLQRLRYR